MFCQNQAFATETKARYGLDFFDFQKNPCGLQKPDFENLIQNSKKPNWQPCPQLQLEVNMRCHVIVTP